MPEIQLKAETGRKSGSAPTRRLRAEGKIPGVIYGHGIEPVPVSVDARELRHALNTEAGVTTDLDPEDAVVVGQPPQVSELDLIAEADAEALAELAAAQEVAAAAEEATAEGAEAAPPAEPAPPAEG